MERDASATMTPEPIGDAEASPVNEGAVRDSGSEADRSAEDGSVSATDAGDLLVDSGSTLGCAAGTTTNACGGPCTVKLQANVGEDCAASALGECARGTYACEGQSLVCKSGVPASETCDEKDNDCDGSIDEDALGARTWYQDCDGDGYGTGMSRSSCNMPSDGACRWVPLSGDCLDSNAEYNPKASAGFVVGNASLAEVDRNCDGALSVPRGVDDLRCTAASTAHSDFTMEGAPYCTESITCDCVTPWGSDNVAPLAPDKCSTGATDRRPLIYRQTKNDLCVSWVVQFKTMVGTCDALFKCL